MLTTRSEGWQDVLDIMKLVVDDALVQLQKYPGTDAQETATLAFVWKTAAAQLANTLATVESRIKEGADLAASYQTKETKTKPADAVPESAIESATAVIPVCDLLPQAPETMEEEE